MATLWQRFCRFVTGRWMVPAGPENASSWRRANDAARFGYRARIRYRGSVDPDHERGEWPPGREAALRDEWEQSHRTPWREVRDHVWRGWTAAGAGQAEDRITH